MALRQNIGFVLLLLLCIVESEISDNGSGDDNSHKATYNSTDDVFMMDSKHSNSKECPYMECNELGASCITCDFNETCVYGSVLNVTCHSKVNCLGEKTFLKPMKCRYCYQTDHWEHSCVQMANCSSVASPKNYYRTNCTVKEEVLCLGRRTFLKNILCNWTGGYRWSTALLLSITLGGFGADRFYLGQWQEGIGKLFSFGGLGVWTLIDVILIAVRYLGPADGSLYL